MLVGTVVEMKKESSQPAKHVEASEDAIQTDLASQREIHFSKNYLVGLTVDTG